MLHALTGLELPDLQKVLGPEQPAFRARQVYQALYRARVGAISDISSLPASLRANLQQRFTVGLPKVSSFFDSSDGTRRYLLSLADGRTVETVLMPEESRDTICISSQVGCPVDCRFCLTAKMGIERKPHSGGVVGA